MIAIAVTAAELVGHPLVVGVTVVALGAIVGIPAYRQTRERDRTATVDAAVTAAGDATKRIINGLNVLLDNVQEDNKELRKQQKRDRVELKRVRDKLTEVEKDCKGIRAELAALNANINGT